MKYRIVVGLAAEDIKAVIVGHPLSYPGYGSTIHAAVGELVIKNFELFDVEVLEGDPNEAMQARRTSGGGGGGF